MNRPPQYLGRVEMIVMAIAKYLVIITYSLFCSFLITVFSTHKYEFLLTDSPEEFANLCTLPELNDLHPQDLTYVILIFLLPLLIPLFLAKKGRIIIAIIVICVFSFWFYSFIVRFNC